MQKRLWPVALSLSALYLILPLVSTPTMAGFGVDPIIEPVQVNDQNGNSGVPNRVGDITVDENDVMYSVWVDMRATAPGDGIYFSKSLDLGDTWESNVQLSSMSPTSGNVDVEIDYCDGTLGLIYNEAGGIYSKSSSDLGQTWSAANLIDTAVNPWDVQLESHQGEAGCVFYAAWSNGATANNYFMADWTSAQDWSTPSPFPTPDNYNKRIAFDVDSNGRVHAAIETVLGGQGNLYYTYSDNSGASWSSLKKLLVGKNIAGITLEVGQIAHNSVEKVFISYSIWVNSSLKFEVAFTSKSVASSGTIWSSPIYINSPYSGWDFSPEMLITDEGVLYLYWQKDTNDMTYERRVFRNVTLDGVNWASEEYLTSSFNTSSVGSDMRVTDVYNGSALMFTNLGNINTYTTPNEF